MSAKKKKKEKHISASPSKSLSQELSALQRSLRLTAQAYEKRLKTDLETVGTWNEDIGKLDQPSREQIRDLGDMLGLLGKVKFKPEKGRRRDLRKIESLIEDLLLLSRQKRTA